VRSVQRLFLIQKKIARVAMFWVATIRHILHNNLARKKAGSWKNSSSLADL
jgi:hypothetical protein